MAETVFWFTALVIAYAFAGFPLTMLLLVRTFGRRDMARPVAYWPGVTIVVSAFNEEAVITAKIANFEKLVYPPERLEMLIVSDGSTDATAEIVRSCGNGRVRLIEQPENLGKTRALNRAAEETGNDILVFTDANSMFDPHAVTRLAERFADPEVGLVSGHSEYEGGGGGGAYRRYEDMLKSLESRLWGIVGADGAIYAMRREMYTPLEPQFINDFLHPIQTVMRGYRAVQEPDAICREPFSVGVDEMGRQTRIMTQSWVVVLSQFMPLLRAGKAGFLWQLIMHKLLRWLCLPLMGVCLAANLALLGQWWLYDAAFAVQVAFYGSAALFRWRGRGVGSLSYGFIVLHVAPILGLGQYMRGERYLLWKPRNS